MIQYVWKYLRYEKSVTSRLITFSWVWKETFLFMLPSLIWHQDCDIFACFNWIFKPFNIINSPANICCFWFAICCMMYFTSELSCHFRFFDFLAIFPFDIRSVSLTMNLGNRKIMLHWNKLAFFPSNFLTVLVTRPHLIQIIYRYAQFSRYSFD